MSQEGGQNPGEQRASARPIGVAIVDSGVNPRHPHIGTVKAGRCFVAGEAAEDYLDYLGHGTAVAGAVCEHAPEVELYIARVFPRQLVTSGSVLLAALQWCLEQPVMLINLSLATENAAYEGEFLACVERARERGIRIVSPARGLPGRLPGVVAVTMDDALPRGVLQAEGESYRACGWPRPIPGLPQERNLHGVSFAVANVTGLLAKQLLEATQLDEAKKFDESGGK